MRREPWAISWGRPMASSTWLGSREPEVQAEPEEAQMPLASSIISRLSPSTPSKEMLTVPGSRCSRSPLRRVWGRQRSSLMRRSVSSFLWARFSSRWETASSMATPSPTMPATFSVPARLPHSCAPPSI